jgi:adenosylmethionine-8-amino-7-oxononanoate aminotransferase
LSEPTATPAATIWEAAHRNYLWPVLSKEELDSGLPLLLASGRGVRVKDVEGREYLDLTSTVSRVSTLGYAEPRMVEAVSRQLERLHHAGSGFQQADVVIELAARLAELTPGDLSRSTFMVSGSEANEAAIKVAKLYQRERGRPRAHKVIGRWNAYHGSVGSATQASDWLGVRAPFEPGAAVARPAPLADHQLRPGIGGTSIAVSCQIEPSVPCRRPTKKQSIPTSSPGRETSRCCGGPGRAARATRLRPGR